MEIAFWISVGLFIIAAIAVALMIRKHNRMFSEQEDPVPVDDTPAQYEYEFSERPFFETY
jgi:hypothetical protein